MTLNKLAKVKRLGIFFFYDKDGVVDEYVIYMLEKMSKHITETIIVCNGKLTIDGRKKFEKLESCKVIVRENKGFDVWAYKTALEYYGWEKITEFDEIIMYNFTIMGPVYELDEMFEKMDSKDVDFWGLTIHNGAPFDPWGVMEEGYIPIHIQSHFIAVRNKMLKSHEFQEYWDKRPMINCYEEAVGLHEAIFTKKFEEHGYKWDVYVNTSDLVEKTFYPLFNMPVELIKNRKCPFFKRKIFISEITSNIQENANYVAAELYHYLKDNTNYNTEMILKHLLRTANQFDMISSMNLNYILPSDYIVNKNKVDNDMSVAIFINLIDMENYDEIKNYLYDLPYNIDIYLLGDFDIDDFRLNNIRYTKLINVSSNSNSNNILLKHFCKYKDKYEVVGIVNVINQKDIFPLTNNRSFAYISYESILKNKDYINNIINLFTDNLSLGMLVPPTPIHSKYVSLLGKEWNAKYSKVLDILHDIKCDANSIIEKPLVVPLGNCYWARTEAISPLLSDDILDKYCDYNEKTFENIIGALECSLSLVAQSRGYYSTNVYPETLAENYLTNMGQYLANINKVIDRKDWTLSNIKNLKEELPKEEVVKEEKQYIIYEVHFDTGNGFNIEEMDTKIITRNTSDKEKISLEIEVPNGTKRIRFDPCEKFMCICNGAKVINKELKLTCHNGINLGENDLFLTYDPQYVISGNFEGVEKVYIEVNDISLFSGSDTLEHEMYKFIEQKSKEHLVYRYKYKFINDINKEEIVKKTLVREFFDAGITEFTLAIPKDVREIEFYPCTGLMCICENIKINSDKLKIYSTNSLKLKNIDLFFNFGPKYIIQGDFSGIEEVKIQMQRFSVFTGSNNLTNVMHKANYIKALIKKLFSIFK